MALNSTVERIPCRVCGPRYTAPADRFALVAVRYRGLFTTGECSRCGAEVAN